MISKNHNFIITGEKRMKTFPHGIVSVALKNGRIVSGSWIKDCRDVHVTCYDDIFFGSYSIDTTDYSVEIDALFCLKQIIINKGGIIE